tara:strand:+ start:253 stop:663 length:411 start_codon:yes stop_codon:yes gene_type:complete
MTSLGNWTNENDASVCADVSPYPTWDEWGAAQRDLYILDHESNVVFHENISNATNWGNSSSTSWLELRNLIENLIDQIPGDALFGDINGDGFLNVLDVVALVNLVLNGSYDELADMNSDGTLNVLDIVSLANIILG